MYQNLQQISHENAETAFGCGAAEAAEAIIRVALYEPERRWAEEFCLIGARDIRSEVRAAAITGFGHLARRHRAVSPDVMACLQSLRQERELGGLVEDALDDILVFTESQRS